MKKRLVLLCALFALGSMVALAADVDGKWMSEAPAGGKGGPQTFTFKASGKTLTGTLDAGRGGPVDIAKGMIDGDKIMFEVTRAGRDGANQTTKYEGTVSGSSIKLTFDNGRGPRDLELKKQ